MRALWNRLHKSVLSLTFENAGGDRLTSGSGFKAGGYLITNNHVIQVPSARTIRSVGIDGSTTAYEAKMGRLQFNTMLKSGQEESGWDYAVLAVDHPEFAAIPDLELKETDEVPIGTEACFLGFQFEQSNLAIHRGLVASSFNKAGVRYIQIDGSINHGNPGGPFIDITDGKVIGIVTRKATGLTQDFKSLDAILAENIRILNQATVSGSVALNGIDPLAAARATQEQLKVVAQNIARSANVGIGFAYHIAEVRVALGLLLRAKTLHLRRIHPMRQVTP